jgi:lysophospholipase L1-like esterase
MIALSLLSCLLNAPNFTLEGRFQPTKQGYVCEWPGSAVSFISTGGQVVVRFRASTSNDRWQVEVNGAPTQILKLTSGESSHTLTLSGPKQSVRLVKRSEAFCGPTEVLSISAAAPASAKKRHLEIIGDSISAGFGVDGKHQEEPYSFETANAYQTYGQIAARTLNASCTTVAWSGKKMWPDNSIPELYDYVLPSVKKHVWNFSKKPDAVVINLATNDFGGGIPDRKGWTTGYKAFVQRVKAKYPKTTIYLATGSMMSDNWPPNAKHLTTLKNYLDQIVADLGDKQVKRIDFAPQEMSNGIGSSWHPNTVTQRKMASVLVSALKRDLRW